MLQKLYESRVKANEESGFTLIELLIVIVILAILAAIVIFGLSGVTSQSAAASCNADAKSTEIAMEAYHAQVGQWPAGPLETDRDGRLTATNNGVRYLRTFAGTTGPNSKHYVISLAAD